MGPEGGHRQLICYNCEGIGQYTHDCTNLMRVSCSHYAPFDHEAVGCPTLITQMHKKGVLHPIVTQNIQMMRFELCEEDPNVNIVLRSGATTGEDKGK